MFKEIKMIAIKCAPTMFWRPDNSAETDFHPPSKERFDVVQSGPRYTQDDQDDEVHQRRLRQLSSGEALAEDQQLARLFSESQIDCMQRRLASARCETRWLVGVPLAIMVGVAAAC